MELDRVADGPEPGPPVLCHDNLGPGNVRRASGGRLAVLNWEHAGGQPVAWELGYALTSWAVGPGGGVNGPGARALLDGYRERAGSLPRLDMAMFRGAVTSYLNHVLGVVGQALDAGDDEERRYWDRACRHLLAGKRWKGCSPPRPRRHRRDPGAASGRRPHGGVVHPTSAAHRSAAAIRTSVAGPLTRP
jgi:hypothetical protein